MSDDIVTRLRGRYCSHGNNYDGAYQPVEWPSICKRCELDRQAADEIEHWKNIAKSLHDVLFMLSSKNISLTETELQQWDKTVMAYDRSVYGESQS